MVRIRRVLSLSPHASASGARRSASAWLLGGALAAGAAMGACSASLDFIECRDDNECNTRFASEGPLRCASGTCVDATCEGHDECEGLGESFACGVDGECVDVAQGTCELLFLPGKKIVEDLVFVGAIYDEAAPEGPEIKAAIKLAAEEFNSKTALASGKQVAMIGCDSGGTVSGAKTAGQHLAETVGVPAIIGPADDEEFIKVASDVSNQAGNYNFTMSPTAISPFPDGAGRVWLTTPGADYYGQAMIDRVIGYSVDSAVMIFSEDNYGINLRNGITVTNADGFPVIPGVANQVNLSYNAEDSDGTAALDALLAQIPAPALVVLLGGDEVGAQIKHLVGLGTVMPEKILITKRSQRAVQAALVELGMAELLARVELIAPSASHPVNGPAVQARIQAKNPSLTALTDAANLAYDAAMTTLFALRALKSSEPIAGPQLASAMGRMTSGKPVSFGDEDLGFIAAAGSEFDMSRTVDLVGASGELALNTVKNEPCGPFLAWGFTDVATATPVATAMFTPECPAATGLWADL